MPDSDTAHGPIYNYLLHQALLCVFLCTLLPTAAAPSKTHTVHRKRRGAHWWSGLPSRFLSCAVHSLCTGPPKPIFEWSVCIGRVIHSVLAKLIKPMGGTCGEGRPPSSQVGHSSSGLHICTECHCHRCYWSETYLCAVTIANVADSQCIVHCPLRKRMQIPLQALFRQQICDVLLFRQHIKTAIHVKWVPP